MDLREIVNDTTLLYIVKVIDQNMRSYNKGFTLYVKSFHHLILQLLEVRIYLDW